MTRRSYLYPPHGVFRDLAPLPPPQKFPAVRVRIVRAFYGAGRLLRPGEVVALPAPSAADAVALRRAEMV